MSSHASSVPGNTCASSEARPGAALAIGALGITTATGAGGSTGATGRDGNTDAAAARRGA